METVTVKNTRNIKTMKNASGDHLIFRSNSMSNSVKRRNKPFN